MGDQVVARSPDLATWPTEGHQPRPRRETCGSAGPPERGGRGLETRAEQPPTGNQEAIPGPFLKTPKKPALRGLEHGRRSVKKEDPRRPKGRLLQGPG